jgi:hypothetical protein
MAFLIRSIDLTADGREIVREKKLAQDRITIGRAAENDVHLPDLAVEQRHARIEPSSGGQLAIEAESTLGFVVDGRHTSSAIIDPRGGAELAIGSYRLALSQEGDGPVSITIRQAEDREGARADKVAGFTLAGVVPGKRPMAWISLAVILLAFLAIPVFSHLTRDRVKPDIDSQGAVLMDASWSTGSLSMAHHGLEDNCEACHVDAFVAVRDDTCLTCHARLKGDHADPDRLDVSRGPMSLEDSIQWAVAHTFNKPGPGACTDCHTEHEGKTRMPPPPQQFCADCHGSLDTRLTDTALGNAADFGELHPQFKAAVFTEAGQKQPLRISLADKPREFSGLRFPHDLHLDPLGGVARMGGNIGAKKGYGETLECKDCHTYNKDMSGFLPVDMEEDCEACHSLVYDKVGSTFRTLRHGDVDEMRADLAAMDRAPRAPIVSGRRRPGQYAAGGIYYQDFGRPTRSLVAINRALSKDGVCGECHFPTTTNGRADVIPVQFTHRYFVNGWFDHEEHKEEECATCHKAETSDSATDVLMPDIRICRDCHLGEDARRAEVPSSCAMCHAYHPREGGRPADHPSASKDRVALAPGRRQ